MLVLMFGFALVASSFAMGLFGFFVGRCARMLLASIAVGLVPLASSMLQRLARRKVQPGRLPGVSRISMASCAIP